MQKVFESERIPKNLHTDNGKEFYNNHFQQLMHRYKINHYSTFSTKKASIVERFNRTLKNKMWKRFSFQGSYKWLNILSDLTRNYNNTKHRTIKMRPEDVNRENEKHLLDTVYKNVIYMKKCPKFKINDYVRISKYKIEFAKGYTPNWTCEIFQIYKIQLTDPVTYKIKDYNDTLIEGCFYEYELLKVSQPNVYLVEKIIRKRGNRVHVKWLGFDDVHNSWINENAIS